MNYFVLRGDQEYGPYTLADLQRYVASGDVQLTDMARGEGLPGPVPVSQIVGTIPVPTPVVAAAPVYVGAEYPDPPNLHWALVLLFGVLTCGIFSVVWDILQAAWMKKVAPQSTAIYYYFAAIAMQLFTLGSGFMAGFRHEHSPLGGLWQLVYFVLLMVSRFSLKSSLEEHFNTAEPVGLVLSGVMTFFFGGVYFQYHLSDIVRRKELGRATGLFA